VRHNNFSIWGQINGKKLTDEHIRQLATKAALGLSKGSRRKMEAQPTMPALC
jgi:hypothetical protein